MDRWNLAFTTATALGLMSLSMTTLPVSAELSAAQDDRTLPPTVLIAEGDFDIIDTAIQQGSLDTFVALLEQLEMAEDLRGYGRFTVFAPSDDAFAAVDEDVMTVLLGDRELLARVLAYHVIALGEPLYSSSISGTTTQRTLERSDIEIRQRGSRLYVNDVRVTEKDVDANNGVIHVIDQVLIPPDLVDRLP